MIIVSCLYADFLEIKYKSIDEIINVKFIESIPEHFTFNFLNLVNQELDLNKNSNNIKKYLNEMSMILKNEYYSKMVPNKETNLEIEYDSTDYTIHIYKSELRQNGGASNIDNKIKNKINKLSILLKNNQNGGNTIFKSITHDIDKYIHFINKTHKYHKQIGKQMNTQNGGTLIDDIKEDKDNTLKILSELEAKAILSKIEEDTIKAKVYKQRMIDKANIWTIQLINENYVIKIIEDNDYGIARFVLKPTKDYEKNKELLPILAFVNGTASILTFKNELTKDAFPILLKVEKLGSVQPTYVTKKLTEYYKIKYDKLQSLKDKENLENEKEQKQEDDLFTKIKKFLGFRGGADGELKKPKDSDTFLEYCFTSRQYNKFLQKMEDYFKSKGKTIEIEELKSLKNEIKEIQKIEEKLIEINKLLLNYKLIDDEFPDFVTKEVTLQHMKNILKNNNTLIDEYGNVNLKTLEVVRNIEKYLELKDTINEELQNPNTKNVVKDLIDRQKYNQNGGKVQSENFNKKYMSFNDYKFFTSTTFQNVLERITGNESDITGGKKNKLIYY
jgi:uncharacterized C2H2 Zn-finger protein